MGPNDQDVEWDQIHELNKGKIVLVIYPPLSIIVEAKR